MLVPHKQHKLQTSSNMGQESRAACPVGSQNQAQFDTAAWFVVKQKKNS
jgi:hypothetical protein